MGSTQKRLGVALIGAGYWDKNLVRNLRDHNNFELRYIVDQPNHNFQIRGDEVLTSDIRNILSDDKVDLVAVATPPDTHESIALEVIQAGKHVLIEKPLATSVAGGRKLVDAASAANVTLMCDHTYCYSPAVDYIKNAIEHGVLGDVIFIDSTRINLGLIQTKADVLWDLAPHDLSILDFILPSNSSPIAVSAVGADPLGIGVDCVSHLNLYLQKETIAHIHVNWLSPTKVRQFVIGGTKKMIVWDDLNPNQRISVYDKGVSLNQAMENPEELHKTSIAYRTGGLESPALPEVEALKLVLDELHESITSGRPPRTDGRSGLRVLQILELATISSLNGGQKITVDQSYDS